MIFDSARPHIAIVGRRNVGKSLLINSLLKQNVSKVSEVAGTTVDPLRTKFELLPYGPVVIVDTAGIDDEGELGRQRITETIKILSSSDFALVVLDARDTLHSKELELFSYLDRIQINYIVVVNKIEFGVNPVLLKELKELRLTHFEVSCKEKAGLDELKRRMIRMLPLDSEKPLVNDIISARDVIVMAVPADNTLPKNKLVFSQVHIIREALDEHAVIVICREKELLKTINNLKSYPDLVIVDSAFFKKIFQDIPDKIKFTTFSIILSRHKGDLPLFIRGLKKINKLENGDKILIAEACTHHIIDDVQDSIKIPKWLKAYTKKELKIDVVQNYNLPDNLSEYKLIVHCGGCLLTHRSMQTRINQARLMDVSVVNYGVINSFIDGAIPRGLLPFPDAVAEWEKA
ncbi:MAG TPA: [FeFe] hydrogenase H-cluster maturation GTPase HydF [Ignavibacteriaceae bacterium]|mgnify:CR=1 FL=1|jgi:[FeFe] hydrogenase H-cluster maturation GTPase HydF|nr:MAG: GTPase Era [Ignavibacteria bacterium ADurb.Bin266]OQY74775.1 MAG: [FeFe] hydrogenase H-cluster maturation GTPase HydF [Ignavibacteriales bacterium UTCHB2]HQF41890.1 [FeFe] hydrogenase H-cluster maturation GTPase HydF [Ignavibacteriaceae bacterium]HQI41862.1 [FeFe] hydrogenase H-cluster maturation GTPase HydF [Ignavibacteriaceae bacterium]HQJ46110.1 [FeFe] hydrogenase H-cluster maturation GTPase HydF [Ignavibacteriaceae bacterium]